jgi:hypothetical protein
MIGISFFSTGWSIIVQRPWDKENCPGEHPATRLLPLGLVRVGDEFPDVGYVSKTSLISDFAM